MRPTGTVTFLFTDIEGSTQLWEHHHEWMERAHNRQEQIMREAVARHNGYAYKMIGDAFQVAFATAPDALAAGLDAQRELHKENWGEVGAIRVRMALHTGVTEERGDDYVGPVLNRVARLMSAGHGGQVLFSNATEELVRDHLPANVSLRDLGERRLKDLIRPERVYQLVASGLPADFPPLKTLDTLPNNLPVQLTTFIGREREMADVKRSLSTTRLLTLTGAGGTGKTRLALQIGADVLETFDDGVWFVELALLNPELVPHAVATALGVREDEGRPLMGALQDWLRAKNLVLILDNCEHLVEACARLADTLLRSSPDLKIIASSRQALGIAGETSFRVPSLSLPDTHHLPPLESLTQFDAVRLFIDRAVSVKSDFWVTNANAPAVAQVCHRLDGIPLAIELAAARVRGLSVEQIAARLDDRFRLLTGGSRTALPRQQTLRTSIDWSYDLLSEAERALLRRLSVFVGDWTLEAAEFVGQDGILSNEILDLLLRLIDKSLVVEEEQGGEARYHLFETIRQYARDKLLESGEADRVRARHLEFFLKFAEEAKPKLRTAEQLKLLDRRRSEYENLRVAVEWAREDSSRISDRPEIELRLISVLEHLGDVYLLLGVRTQAITFYQHAVALCTSLAGADKMNALRLHGKIVETARQLLWAVDFERFEAFATIGAASLSSLKAELQLAENFAPDPEMIRLFTILSEAAWDSPAPDWDAAQRYARAAVDMAEKLDVPIESSMALLALGNVYFARGLLRERVQVALRRLALSRDSRFSDARQRISILRGAGDALGTVGEFAQAMPYLNKASSLAEQILAVDEQRSVKQHIAYCLFRLDRWDEVLEILDQVRDIQKRYPRERAGPECFSIALGSSVHTRRGESHLGAAEREEAHSIMTTTGGPLDGWARAQIH